MCWPVIGSAVILLITSVCAAQQGALGEASYARYYPYPDQLPAEFCAKHKLSCVLDLTSTLPQCEFSSPIRKELNKATLAEGLQLLEKQCRGYRWRISGSTHLFEPRANKESHLGRHIRSVDLKKSVSPEQFIFHLVEAANLQMAPGHGLGAKSQDKPAIRFKTSAGSLKAALISAANQYPGTSWSIVKIQEGFIFNVR